MAPDHYAVNAQYLTVSTACRRQHVAPCKQEEKHVQPTESGCAFGQTVVLKGFGSSCTAFTLLSDSCIQKPKSCGTLLEACLSRYVPRSAKGDASGKYQPEALTRSFPQNIRDIPDFCTDFVRVIHISRYIRRIATEFVEVW